MEHQVTHGLCRFRDGLDSIERNMFWKILRHYRVLENIIRLVQVFHEGFQARVLHEGDVTEPFDMKTGVHQGCLLSPLLFLVEHWVT